MSSPTSQATPFPPDLRFHDVDPAVLVAEDARAPLTGAAWAAFLRQLPAPPARAARPRRPGPAARPPASTAGRWPP